MWGWDGASILVDKGALIWPWSEGAMWWPLCRSEAFTQREGGGGGGKEKGKRKKKGGAKRKGEGKGKGGTTLYVCYLCEGEEKVWRERKMCLGVKEKNVVWEKVVLFKKKKKNLIVVCH